jgi:RHS repeat-associated protein
LSVKNLGVTESAIGQQSVSTLSGSVIVFVDPTSQTVKTGYGYSPFGSTTKSNNNSNNNLLFTGRELDLGATVYYFRGRYYNAGFQRFLSIDDDENQKILDSALIVYHLVEECLKIPQ